MKNIKTLIPVLVLSASLLVSAQDSIHIVGEVADSVKGLSGAFVMLQGEQITVETDADGKFEIIKLPPIKIEERPGPLADNSTFAVRFLGGKIFLNMPKSVKSARLDIYNILGRKLYSKNIANSSVPSFSLQHFLGRGFGSGLYIAAVTIGPNRYVIKLLNLESHILTGTCRINKGPEGALAKIAAPAVDTLLINRLGYYPLKVPLSAYQAEFLDSNKIIMQASQIPCIDVGGMLLGFVNTYTLRWSDAGSGYCQNGAFWMPNAASTGGFLPLGSYARRGGTPGAGEYVVVVKEIDSSGAVKHPVDYQHIWSDQGTGSSSDGSFWRPVPPAGYVALGVVAQSGYNKPPLDQVVCVRQDLTTRGALGTPVWIYNSMLCANVDIMVGLANAFHTMQIKIQDVPAFGSFPIACGTFSAFVNGSSGLPDPAELNCLNVKMPMIMDNMEQPVLPKLNGLIEPANQTEPHFGKVMVVPFSVINDTNINTAWQVANTPFYRVERYQYYKKLFYMINNGSMEWPWSESITTGITQTQSQRFWQTTGISVTASAGFEFKGFSAGVSVTVSKEFGYESSSSISMYTEKTVTKTATVPAHKIGILWQKHDLILMKRCNNDNLCQDVGAQVVPLESYYYDEIDAP